SYGHDEGVIVQAGSGAQVDGLLTRIDRADAVADHAAGQRRELCLVGVDESGGDGLVDQRAVVRGEFRIDDRRRGDLFLRGEFPDGGGSRGTGTDDENVRRGGHGGAPIWTGEGCTARRCTPPARGWLFRRRRTSAGRRRTGGHSRR